MKTTFKPKYLVYAFTGYSFFQLLGFLGTAYPVIQTQIVFIIVLFCFILLVLGLDNWAKKQNQTSTQLAKHQVIASFSGSLAGILLILFIVLVGSWIA